MITEAVLPAALPVDFCPYKGLQPYTEADRPYFFGRERDREIIISNLYAAPLTVLYGASGVGKSSVLLAGVVPQLKETPRIAVSVFRSWQGNILQALKDKILSATKESLGRDIAISFALPLDEFVAQCTSALRGHIFVILDQFEEYFLYNPSETLSDFDAEFARAVNRQEISVNFLLCMREDSLSKLDRFQKRIPNLLSNMLRLDHLDKASAIAAIHKPLIEYNKHLPAERQMQIENQLVEALLEEVKPGKVIFSDVGQGQTKEGQLEKATETRIETPLLQMVLTRLWSEELATGSHTMQLQTLARLGGAESIARTHLNEVMKRLSSQERNDAASLLRFLVTPAGTKIAQEAGAFALWAKLPEERVIAILTRLGESDIRIVRPVHIPGQPMRYEILHDVLAVAVLDWRRRYDEQQTQEQIRQEAQARRDQEQAEAERQRSVERTRFMRMGIVVLIGTLIVMAGLLYKAITGQNAANDAQKELKHQLAISQNFQAEKDKLNQELQEKYDELSQKNNELIASQAQIRNAKNASEFVLKGQIHLQSSNYGDAIRDLRKASQIDQSNPATNTLLGYAMIMNGNVKGAIKVLEETARNSPDYGWAQYNLALAYFRDGREADAIEEIRNLLDTQPKFWQEFEKDNKFRELKKSKDYMDLINKARGSVAPL